MIFLPTGLDDLEIGGVVIQCQLERPLTGFAIHCHVPWLPECSLPVPVVFMAAFDSIASVLSVATSVQLYCESWQVVPGVASGCTRVFPRTSPGKGCSAPITATQTGSPRSARRKLLAALSRCTPQTSATPALQPSGCSASNTNIPAHRSQRSRFPRTPAWVV